MLSRAICHLNIVMFDIICYSIPYGISYNYSLLYYAAPPTKLNTFPEPGNLTLTWAPPVQDDFKIEFYKILYTSNEWKDTENISVKATQLSCTIPNVLPMKTYRFTISSCLKNVEGKPSIEHLFKSGGKYTEVFVS